MPDIEGSYRAALEKAKDQITQSNTNYNSDYADDYWAKEKNACFKDDSTGELIDVSVQKYPKYYYINNISEFWKNQLSDYIFPDDLILYSKDSFQLNDDIKGYKIVLRDTGSSRTINRIMMLKDDYMFSFVTIGDTLNQPGNFIRTFFKTFSPEQKKIGRNLSYNCLDSFFTDLFSKDSATHSYAEKHIGNVYFGEAGVTKIITAINRLKSSDKDYYDTKAKLINELGYIKDTTKPIVVNELKKLYTKTSDTSLFQNKVITALAQHTTTDAYQLLKDLMLQDPPVFDNDYEYSSLFADMKDSLALAATLYPDLLQLATLDDYKEPVRSLLVTLVDSGYVKTPQYENYFSKIYFDAKIELKKQLNKDEQKIANASDKDDDNTSYNDDDNSNLDEYAVLLMPFYDSNPNVPKFFEKLLSSQSQSLKLNTAILMLQNKKPVADSILLSLASSDKYRGQLHTQLDKINRTNIFPAKYKTQLAIARSYLVEDKEDAKIDSIVFLSKQLASYDNKKGIVYFFKYRIKKEDDWKIGISGLQPLDIKKVSSDDKLASMTDKKINDDDSLDEQLQEQLKHVLFLFHKSAKNYFDSNTYSSLFKGYAD